MQITLTGDAKKDAALLHKARKRHILAPVALGNEIAEKVRLSDIRFHDIPHRTGDPTDETGKITIGVIRGQSGGTICEY